MFALDHLLDRARHRSLELIILQFLIVVILPNNDVGTPELPAVGAKVVRGAQGSRSVSPVKDNPPPRIARRPNLPLQSIERLLSASCASARAHAAASLLTPRLRL
ncbi:MAG: hypothetical protein HY290_03825 [Planctomycetia bacterium]|nr:hypothetical protein [Planctomycetia bacterium]